MIAVQILSGTIQHNRPLTPSRIVHTTIPTTSLAAAGEPKDQQNNPEPSIPQLVAQEGLSAIITAIRTSRVIFARLQSYIIYRIASSLLILGFFFFSAILLGLEMPTWAIIVINITNDASVMATSLDLVSPTRPMSAALRASVAELPCLGLPWRETRWRGVPTRLTGRMISAGAQLGASADLEHDPVPAGGAVHRSRRRCRQRGAAVPEPPRIHQLVPVLPDAHRPRPAHSSAQHQWPGTPITAM